MVRVRYAPSPTGTLHIGGARTALFNYLFARHEGGTFVLRIEDTDQAREVEGSAEAMMAGLRSLGILWDEGPDVGGAHGPYRQSERLRRYQADLERLRDADRVYPCFCTPEELAAVRQSQQQAGKPPRYAGTCRNLSEADIRAREGQPYVLRFRLPEQGATIVEDMIRGSVRFEHAVLDDFVVRKSDGMPVYNFAVVVDDYDMAISHVIRGEEHLSNTPKQILLFQALGYPIPAFAHVPMILAPDRSKLSKRHGATSVAEYRDLGILPEALVNYLALLGWSPPDGEEFFTLEKASRSFALDRIQHTAAVYDQKKLEWMNAQYLRDLPLEHVAREVRPFLADIGVDPDHPEETPAVDLPAAVQLVRERSRTLRELADQMAFLYRPVTEYDPAGIHKHFGPDSADRLRALAEALERHSPFAAQDLNALYQTIAEGMGIPRAQLIHPTRLALTGRTVGPGLFELMAALGRTASVVRLRRAAAFADTLAASPRTP